MAYSYSSVNPENLRDTGYTELENIDFVLSFSQRSMVLNSLRLEGELEVQQSSGPLTTEKIFYDPFVGAHAFIESVLTTVNGEVVENLVDYGRYCSMLNKATIDEGDAMNSGHSCELVAPFEQFTTNVLKGEKTPSTNNQQSINPDFSIKLKSVLNSAYGALPYRRTGDIRMTVNLARVYSALYGRDVNSDTSYTLKNLKMCFATVPDDGSNELVPLRTKMSLKQSLSSQLSNISAKVPGVVSSVSCSFQPQNQENTARYNNYQLVKVPGLNETVFSFDDSTNAYITFTMRDNEELIGRYIESFQDTGYNLLSVNAQANRDGFGIGLRFSKLLDLRNKKLGIQLNSDISSSNPMIIYMYFHSLISL